MPPPAGKNVNVSVACLFTLAQRVGDLPYGFVLFPEVRAAVLPPFRRRHAASWSLFGDAWQEGSAVI